MIKNSQDKKRDLKQAYSKKFTVTDGRHSAYANANDIKEALGCSKSYAYKIIKGTAKLSTASMELLQMKLLGIIPGMPGYYITKDGIETPNGYMIQLPDMENISLTRQLLSSYQSDTAALREENAKLIARIEWLNAKLAQPDKLRAFTGGPRVVRFKSKKEA